MKKGLTAVIVDDERLAREGLIAELSHHPEINIIGEADDVESALTLIEQLHPEIIFLDIQMPRKNGFELVELIDPEIKIVFVTAYDEYAIKAFEVNALDYLMKPIKSERLAKTVERLLSGKQVEKQYLRKLRYDDQLFTQLNARLAFIRVNSILCITSSGDYSDLTLIDGKKGLVTKSMKEWEARLPEAHFFRIHRTTIINLNFVERIEKWFHGNMQVHLKGDRNPHVISRRYANELKEKLG